MNIEVVKKIKLDFYDNKFLTINAKQYDEVTRYVQATCCIGGAKIYLDPQKNLVFVRYSKPDEYAVFNNCTITNDGDVLIELSKQMLTTEGLCLADVMILNQFNTDSVDDSELKPPTITEDGEIILNTSTSVISTMKFYVNVLPAPFDYDELESFSEFQALSDLFNKAYQDYSEVITESKKNKEIAEEAAENAKTSETNAKTSETNAKSSETNAGISASNAEKYSNLSKSYAVGDTGVREEENTDNSKYYSEQSQTSASSASSSAIAAKNSEANAKSSETNAKTYASNADASAKNAEASAAAAAESAAQVAEVDISTMIQLSLEEPSVQPINGLWLKEVK